MLIFGSISYINLLPFQMFIKKNISSTQFKQIINHKKGYPSLVNKKFRKRSIDAAFISSIKSSKCSCTNIGIIANGKVMSVLLLPNENQDDIESDTSNMLAKVLKLSGQVVIGDKALKQYLRLDEQEFIDLSEEWNKQYNLPFVFARLCFNKNGKKIRKLANKFVLKKEKIAWYYLKKASAQIGLTPKETKLYLEHIYYKIGHKEKKSLKLFFKKVKARRTTFGADRKSYNQP